MSDIPPIDSEASDNSAKQEHRPIRSYVIRASRYTDAQKVAIDQHWDDYVIAYEPRLFSTEELFGNSNPLTVEIGFGMGDSLLEMAAANPQINFLGIEVHKPGVGKLLHGVVEQNLSNVKVFCHDAKEILAHCLPPASIARLLIFFPDPWHKKRHNKRRLVQTDFITQQLPLLADGGRIHLATDWEPYAEHMVEAMEAVEGIENLNGAGQFWQQPDRPETKFERRGIRLGHGVWDLLYAKG
jgi:tRNA (guanine-N7-)-methyltransferase